MKLKTLFFKSKTKFVLISNPFKDVLMFSMTLKHFYES